MNIITKTDRYKIAQIHWTQRKVDDARTFLESGRRGSQDNKFYQLFTNFFTLTEGGAVALQENDGFLRIVVSEEDVWTLLHDTYYDPAIGFKGRDIFFKTLNKNYLGVKKRAIMDFLKKQEVDQLLMPTHCKAMVWPILAKKPNYHWQADTTMIHQWYERGKNNAKYLLVVVDIFSRLCFIQPLTENSGPAIARAFETIIHEHINNFGNAQPVLPTKIQTDQGSEFDNAAVRNTLRQHNINLVFGTSYHPTAQALVERTYRTIKKKDIQVIIVPTK